MAEKGAPGGGAARRLRQLLMMGPYYVRNAWWGLVGSKVRPPLWVVHAVVVRETPAGARELLLAVRSDLRGWELPGGNLEAAESPRDALLRETFEETGLRVEVGERTGLYHRTGFLPHTADVYLCREVGGTLTPSPETPRVRWWPEDALPWTLFPWLTLPIADALAHVPGAAPVERTDHQGLPRILAAARIDLSMRLSDDEAG